MASAKLSEAAVKTAEVREDDYVLFDGDVRGFGAVIYASGSRSFVMLYRFRGRQRRVTIGRYPEWSVAAARERARVLRREIDAGIDPAAVKAEARLAPTFADLVDRYEREHLPRLAARNASDQKSMLHKLVMPEWRNRLVEEITLADVERLLDLIAKGRRRPAKESPRWARRKDLAPEKPTPIRANRCGEVLRKMFSLAVKWGMRQDNPATGFAKRMEVERERYLTLEEVGRLAAALDAAEDQRGVGIIRALLLTGARLGEVRTARFEHFSLEHAIWTKPAASTKQRKVHRVPISADMVALVRSRRAAVPKGCPWLFPGDVEGQPVQDLRRFWSNIQTAAKLEGVRLHDLRHSFASFLVSGGASLEMIGKLLGHSQMKTTQRYAHLMDSPLRAGLAAVGEIVRPRLRVVGDD